MSFNSSNPVTVGAATKKDHYDRLMDNTVALYGGAMSLSGQASLDFLYALSNTQLGRKAKGSALQYPRINAAANDWEFADLISGATTQMGTTQSGTSTAAGGATLGSIPISGLGLSDALLVQVSWYADVNGAVTPMVYHLTDSTSLYSGGTVAANSLSIYNLVLRSTQFSALIVGTSGTVNNNGSGVNAAKVTTLPTTAWTSAWNLGLNFGGINPGGTLYYRYSAYQLKG